LTIIATFGSIEYHNTMNLHLKLRGEQGHSWPKLTVTQKKHLNEYEIQGYTELDISLDNAPFSIGMNNKLFGQNRLWDTKTDSDNNIIADKLIWIDRFEIDEVDITHLFSKISYHSLEQGLLTIHDKCIRFNGHWYFDIGDNPYDWIIDINTQKTNEYRDTSYFSDFTILNNYTDHYHFINKIRKLLGI